jgi:hypothetical protein
MLLLEQILRNVDVRQNNNNKNTVLLEPVVECENYCPRVSWETPALLIKGADNICTPLQVLLLLVLLLPSTPECKTTGIL